MTMTRMLRMTVCAAILAAGVAGAARAEEQRAGHITFTMPTGWKLSDASVVEQARILILPGGEKEAAKGAIVVLPDTETGGNLKEAFAQAVTGAVGDRKGKLSDLLTTQDARGNTVLAQGVQFEDGTIMMVMGVELARKLDVLIGQTKDAGVFAEVVRVQKELINGMKFVEGATGGAAETKIDEGKFRKGDVAGVWMGFKPYVGSYEPRPDWYTFFEDGQVFVDLPPTGLRGFNRAASKADKGREDWWETYTFKDGAGKIERAGGAEIKLAAVQEGQIKLDDIVYYRCADVDGLRLEGAWSTYRPGDEAVLSQPVGKRPIFRFKKNGTFTDEGVFESILKSYKEGEIDNAGDGQYEVKDFTMTLRYGDGHIRTVSVTGFLGIDPAKDDKIVFLGKAQFFRMK